MELTGHDTIMMVNAHPQQGVMRVVNHISLLWPELVIESSDDLASQPFRSISKRLVMETISNDQFNLAFFKNHSQIGEQSVRGYFLDGDAGPFTIMLEKRHDMIGRAEKLIEIYSSDRDFHELPFEQGTCHICMHSFYQLTLITPVDPSENSCFSKVLDLLLRPSNS